MTNYCQCQCNCYTVVPTGDTLCRTCGGAELKPEAHLVEALEDIAGTHHHSASAGEYFAKVARRALADYRKQGGEE